MVINEKSHTAPNPVARHFQHLSWLLLPLSILTISASAFAHGGHGNEFGGQEGTKSTKVQVDETTAQQIGVQTVAAKKQSLNVEISATGQIELLPSKKVEVTAPIKGKLVQLLVQPGARVKAGQILARMSSPELNELRTSSLEKRSTAIALLQQAQTDRNLAQQSYQKIVEIATAETDRARSQLTAAQSRLAREQQLRANAQGIVTITAPIDGTIADRDIKIGQSVADPGVKLMTITDDRQVLATANIYERDLGRLKIGQQVSVKVPGAGDWAKPTLHERVFSGHFTNWNGSRRSEPCSTRSSNLR